MNVLFYKTWWFRLSAVAILVGGVFWYNDFSANQRYLESTQKYRDMYNDAQAYELVAKASIAQEEAMLRADTYGGETPEKTLELFVQALEQRDAKLASKYYMPWLQANAEKDMSEWMQDESFEKFIEAYNNEDIRRGDRAVNAALEVYPKGEDLYHYTIEMEQNSQTKLWKITEF